MKKLIAILTVMIVLVGAIFADPTPAAAGSSKIEINASIKAREPQFRLAVVATENAKYTLGTPSFSDVTLGTVTAGKATINEDALNTTGTNVTVSFAIQQISEAVTYTKYFFEVSATALALQEDTNNTATHIAELAAGSKTISVQSATPTITAVTVSNVTPGESGTTKISQKYTGTRVNASSDSPVGLGTFSVTYLGNTEAVPGTYKGDVTLTVTSL